MPIRLFIAAWVLLANAFSQEVPEDVGFIRIVNLVAPGEGRSDFSLDGKALYKKGYRLGQMTGGMGLRAGSYDLTVDKAGCESGSRRIKVEPGETQTFVAYAQAKLDDLGNVDSWTIDIGRLRQSTPEKGYNVTFVSFCKRQELTVGLSIDGGAVNTQVVNAKLALRVPVPRIIDGVVVSVDGKNVTTFTVDATGNYVVLLYDGEGDEVLATSFYDPKFLVAG